MSRRKRSKSKYTVPEIGLSDNNRRPAKVADTIQSEIAQLLIRKISDPRVVGITISSVKVTSDLRNAIIYFSCADDTVAQATKGLESAQGFIRSALAKRLALRYMPKLLFRHDQSVSRHEEMNKIFREIKNERQSSQ